MFTPPITRYARSADGAWIAYQATGEGPVDLIYLSPWMSHIEVMWEFPGFMSLFRGAGSFARVILMDPRGVGMSDRRSAVADLDTRSDDIRAVLDAAGSDRAVLWGSGTDGGALCSFFAATYPDRVLGLILWNASARTMWAPDYPSGISQEQVDKFQELMAEAWGLDERMPELMREAGAVSIADDPETVRWFSKLARFAVSPGDALAYDSMFNEIDYRGILPAIRIPTCVMFRPEATGITENEAKYIAERIPGASLVTLPPGPDHPPYLGDIEATLRQIQAFIDSVKLEQAELDRVLATVLFTDVVGSTRLASELGDRAWKEALDKHNSTIRGLLRRYRGTEIDKAGDGFFATFDGPARAVRCAQAICASMPNLGFDVRAGVHTGEIERAGEDFRGIAVHIGSRVASLAGPGEVLVSSTVKDLVVGSGLTFADAGEHELKGVPDSWHLFRLAG